MVIMDSLLDEKNKNRIFIFSDLEKIKKIQPFNEEFETKSFLRELTNETILLDPYLQLDKKEESENISLELVQMHLNEIIGYSIFLCDLPAQVNGITLLNQNFLINANLFQNINKEMTARFDISYIIRIIASVVMLHEIGHSKRIIGYGGRDMQKHTPQKFSLNDGKKPEAGFFVEDALFGLILDLAEITQNENTGIKILTLLKEKECWHSKNLMKNLKSQLDSDSFQQITNANLKISRYKGCQKGDGFGILQII